MEATALLKKDHASVKALFKKFEKDHPKSIYLPQVRALVARLTAEAPRQ